ncbi:uncharacterized protein LTR77_006778 [Saxophila tyrrhenica]|uniref:Thiol methyltransferase 2 n=1 Tax=Saxophila tyrrhenica TaxID=1690608 RepID=A0AAV9P5S0_9PEZI|nr:hypothetical protein LTR77_006778 [Saxophila tyrrhenica]
MLPHYFYQITVTDWSLNMEQPKVDEQREELRKHFLRLSDEKQVNGWDYMWQKEVTPWDRKRPTPALVDALAQKGEFFASPLKSGGDGGKMRKKAFVPGCGRGYDVLLFASYGFDAYGLDVSATAIKAAEELLREQDKEQIFPVQHVQAGRGEPKFIEADFFKDDFLSEIGVSKSDGPFDLIYDYTFLCALPPSMRPRWAARMSELLSPTGTLVCMEFPLGKDPNLGGPPHGLTHDLYEQLFAKPGNEVRYNISGHVCADRSGETTESALVRVETWSPERCFEGQEKSTTVSLWRHKKN